MKKQGEEPATKKPPKRRFFLLSLDKFAKACYRGVAYLAEQQLSTMRLYSAERDKMPSDIFALVLSSGPFYPKLLALIQCAGSGGTWSPFGIPETTGRIAVEGDPTAPPTRWWNHAFQLPTWRWIVFSVPFYGKDDPVWVVYYPTNGHHPMKRRLRIGTKFVALRIGHEHLKVLFVNKDGVPMQVYLVQNNYGKDPVFWTKAEVRDLAAGLGNGTLDMI